MNVNLTLCSLFSRFQNVPSTPSRIAPAMNLRPTFSFVIRSLLCSAFFTTYAWCADIPVPAPVTQLGDSVNGAVDADILLTGGHLYLGDLAEPMIGDLAMKDDKIVAVGQFTPGEVKLRIDCSGLSISPGFIDLHNHSDRGVLDPSTRAVVNYLTQGCTTIVTGNCGSGPIDVGSYYKQLDELGVGVNVAHLLPQGALREEVIGSENRAATDAELSRMQALAEQAMTDGAWGMSSGLIYVPSSFASTDELIALAKIIHHSRGVYASHIRGEGTNLLESVSEALRIGRESGAAVHVSHFKSSGKDSWGLVRSAAEMIQQAREQGQRVTADQYPYTASSTSLSATVIPAWARAGTRDAMLARLQGDSDESIRLRDDIAHKLDVLDGGHRIQISQFKPRSGWAGLRLDEIARQEQMTPFELLLFIENNGGASIVNHSINEDDVRYVMTLGWVATASDGGARVPSDEVPHPRSYGTFPRKIGHYAIREQVISTALAVRSSSGLPADILGMTDRGYLRTGYAADVVVWQAQDLIDTATFIQPHQYSAGMKYVFVNGQPAIFNGHVTGALHGKPLRHVASSVETNRH